MKQNYYVNNEAQSNGDHEVHTESCFYYPEIKSKAPLGEHESCKEAVLAAKKVHYQVNGCIHCCRSCHTS